MWGCYPCNFNLFAIHQNQDRAEKCNPIIFLMKLMSGMVEQRRRRVVQRRCGKW